MRVDGGVRTAVRISNQVVSAAMQSPCLFPSTAARRSMRCSSALDSAERKHLTRGFEQDAIGQAYDIMLLSWQRIVVHTKRVKGWRLTASHYLGNDLIEVWLDP